MSGKSSNMIFTGHHRQLKAPFVIYAGFESIEPHTNKYQDDIACSYGSKLYVLMIDLASLNKEIETQVQFTNLLAKCMKKLSSKE